MIDMIDETGRTPLHFAAFLGNHVAVRMLIMNGAKVNARDYKKKTPLFYATTDEVKKLLIDNGALRIIK